MIRIFCELCKKHQPIQIEPLTMSAFNDGIERPWGDVMCSVCHLVITTITGDEEGKYEIVKVSDL